jgi:hypothetical protein
MNSMEWLVPYRIQLRFLAAAVRYFSIFGHFNAKRLWISLLQECPFIYNNCMICKYSKKDVSYLQLMGKVDKLLKDTSMWHFYLFNIVPTGERWRYPCKRPWRPIGLWDVEIPTFFGQSTHAWLWGIRSYAPSTLFSLRKVPSIYFC